MLAGGEALPCSTLVNYGGVSFVKASVNFVTHNFLLSDITIAFGMVVNPSMCPDIRCRFSLFISDSTIHVLTSNVESGINTKRSIPSLNGFN